MNKKATMDALSLMDEWLAKTRSEKRAAGTDPSEPTTHPVMNVEDGTSPAKSGARSAENEADIKKALGEAGTSGQEDSSKNKSNANATTNVMEADEKGGNVPTPKATKDAPESSHPTNALFNEKYSKVIGLGDSILENFIKNTKSVAPVTKEASAPVVPGKPETALATKTAAEKYPEDAQAGYTAAAMLAQMMGFTEDPQVKQAEDAFVSQVASNIIKVASEDAQNLVDYLNGLSAGEKAGTDSRFNKAATHTKVAFGGPDAGAGGGMGGIPPELLAAAGGGGGDPTAGGGGGDPAAAGGLPPEAGGGDPMGGMGGDPTGGGAGGGGDEQAIIEAIADALDQAGVTPEELAQVVAEAQQGGGGGDPMGGMGGDPAAGGPPPGAGAGGPPQAPAQGGGEESEPAEQKESKPSEKKEEKEAMLRRIKKAAIVPRTANRVKLANFMHSMMK